MSVTAVNVSAPMSRKEWVLSEFRSISQYKRAEAGSVEYNDLQERVVRARRNVWGKEVSREVMLSVSPEKAAEDYLNSAIIYVQPMLLGLLGPVGQGIGVPGLAPLGPPRPIAVDRDLENEASKYQDRPEESSFVA